MQRLFHNAFSLILTNIEIDALEHIDELEVHLLTYLFYLWTILTLGMDFQGSLTTDAIGLIILVL